MVGSLLTVIRDLQRPRGRERRKLTLAEGVRLIEEAMARNIEIAGAVISPALEKGDRGRQLLESLNGAQVRIERTTEREFRGLAETEQPQGIVAIVKPKEWSLNDVDIAN